MTTWVARNRASTLNARRQRHAVVELQSTRIRCSMRTTRLETADTRRGRSASVGCGLACQSDRLGGVGWTVRQGPVSGHRRAANGPQFGPLRQGRLWRARSSIARSFTRSRLLTETVRTRQFPSAEASCVSSPSWATLAGLLRFAAPRLERAGCTLAAATNHLISDTSEGSQGNNQ